ncbi:MULTISPECIES: hypothetical protein [Vibrio]|uniref:Uncharacterized protein n=1 Tax=Vibrio harveyi TaxID=669 RepID=A0ABN4L059_VIBHA|nr:MULTISPECIES: hypothetical protein [Vibrio]AMF98743.1 hypothetical protein AL538_13990 [Vibrio harveyi]
MAIHRPDGWVCIRLSLANKSNVYRIFGSWAGGFESPDLWRLSSGFIDGNELELDNGILTIPQLSGSSYQVNVAMQNVLTAYNRSILSQILQNAERACDEGQEVSVDVIELKCDSLSQLRKQL